MRKHYDPKNLGKKGFIQRMPPYHSLPKEVRTGTQVDRTYRSHRRVLLIDLFLMTSSAYILRESRTTNPGITPPTMGWAPSITNLENVLKACLQLDLMETFSQLRLSPLWWLQYVSNWRKTNQHSICVSVMKTVSLINKKTVFSVPHLRCASVGREGILVFVLRGFNNLSYSTPISYMSLFSARKQQR